MAKPPLTLHLSQIAAIAVDALLVAVAWWFAYQLRFNFELPAVLDGLVFGSALAVALVYAGCLVAARVYAQVWRLTSLLEIRRLGAAIAVAGLMVAAATLLFRELGLPRTVIVVHPVLCLMLLAAARAAARSASERADSASGEGAGLLLMGDLDEAAAALRGIKGSKQWMPVAVVSPQPTDQGRSLGAVPVLGGFDGLADHISATQAKAVLIAGAKGSATRRAALLAAGGQGVAVLTLPTADDMLADGSAAPRRVQLEDLLGRPSVALDEQALSELFAGRCVMVTGGAGSIGAELCRQLARFGVNELVCADISEVGLYALDQELNRAHPQLKLRCYTANVREYDRLLAIAQAHRPAVILHAAAYKHVPLMEERNEVEALRTNVMGTLNSARVAGACGSQRFVLISTDKAVNPTNVMGASKRLAERLVHAVAREFAGTQFVSVRFGNVLGSSGSVVPLFTQQIERGGPVSVTHPDIVRYFMTIPEACRLVLQAGQLGQSGQIFVLDMGEPVRIVELARMMIRLSGKTEAEIPIQFTGLRPGEKLYEELLASDETSQATPHAKLRIAKVSEGLGVEADAVAQWIARAGGNPSSAEVRGFLCSLVPEYQARASVVG